MRFLIAGGINSAFGFAAIMFCMKVLLMSPTAANAAGYLAGFAFSFVLHRRFTFRSKIATANGILLYFGVVSIAYSLNLLTLLGLTKWFGINAYLSQIVSVGMYVVIVFFGSRHFVFGDLD